MIHILILHFLNLQEQQAFIENLSMRYNKFSTEVGEFMANVGASINTVEGSCRDTQFQLKELKDYVDHFADNLVLSSGQITVETDAGFTAKPVSLTETLKLARSTLTEIETGTEKTEERIEQICTDLDSKAPDTVLFNVSTLERKVSTIEVHLRKEEEQGIGVRRHVSLINFLYSTVHALDIITFRPTFLYHHELNRRSGRRARS